MHLNLVQLEPNINDEFQLPLVGENLRESYMNKANQFKLDIGGGS